MPQISTMILNSLVMSGEKSLDISTFTQNETSYHLSRLNSMMDSWSNERLFVPYLSQTSFALTTSTIAYSIGPGGAFNMPRPMRLVDPCFIRDTSNVDTELEILNMESYGRITQKNASGSYPSYIAYDGGYSATSTATIYLWPGPVASLTLFINTLQALQTFSTVTVTLQLPPGYQDAIEANYAVRSAIGVIPVSADLKDLARTTKAAIKSHNLPAPISRLDYGVTGGYVSNIITGP